MTKSAIQVDGRTVHITLEAVVGEVIIHLRAAGAPAPVRARNEYHDKTENALRLTEVYIEGWGDPAHEPPYVTTFYGTPDTHKKDARTIADVRAREMLRSAIHRLKDKHQLRVVFRTSSGEVPNTVPLRY